MHPVAFASLLLLTLSACGSSEKKTELPKAQETQAPKTSTQAAPEQESKAVEPSHDIVESIVKEIAAIAAPPLEPYSPDEYQKHLELAKAHAKTEAWENSEKSARLAIAEKPGGAQAHVALAKATLGRGELEHAKAAAMKAIAFGSSLPTLQAAGYAILGHSFAKQEKSALAIESFSQSYRLLPSAEVEQELSRRKVPLPNSQWQGKALQGPFQSLEDYCKIRTSELSPDSDLQCSPNLLQFPLSKAMPDWLKAIGAIESYNPTVDNEPQILLVLKTQKGWFVKTGFEKQFNRYAWSVEEVSSKNGSLLLKHSNSQGRFDTQLYRFATACALGANDTPSCTSGIRVFDSYTGYTGSKSRGRSLPEKVRLHCNVELSEHETFLISDPKNTCVQPGLVGTHSIHFP